MEDKHTIADIITETIRKDGKIDGVTMAHIRHVAEMPEYRINRAIDDLIELGVVTFRRDAVMLTNEFTYGYQYDFKRLWYDEFSGKRLHDKIQCLKGLKDRKSNGEIGNMEYYYVLGRIDQNSFAVGYI